MVGRDVVCERSEEVMFGIGWINIYFLLIMEVI